MNKFLTSLSPQQAKLLYIAVFIVVLALFDRLLVGPTVAKLASINEAIVDEEKIIRRDLQYLSYKDRILKEVKTYEANYVDKLPKEEDVMASFLEKLDTFVKESELTLIKNNRSAEQESNDQSPKDFLVYKADLECSGSLESMANLMYKIDTSKEFYKILKLNLSMKKTGEVEEMRAAMTVAKYIIPSESVLLAAASSANDSTKEAAK